MDNTESKLVDLIKTLNLINFQLADLVQMKEALERQTIELTGRASFEKDEESGKWIMFNIVHDGRKTHKAGNYKFEIKTEYNVSIDKEEYETIKSALRPEFNPVVEKVAYTVNNGLLRDLDKYGSDSDKGLVKGFLKKNPAKPSVTVKANV